MSSIVEIIIKTIDEATEGNSQIVGSFTELNSAINLGREAIDAVKQAYEATIGSTLSYADSVRQVSLQTGTTTEEASRLIDVTEKLGVDQGTLTMAMKFLAKEGIQPNIENLAALSDQFLKLAPGVDRDNFLIQNFGRSGLEMATFMAQGSSAIMQMNNQTEKQLVLTQSQVDQAHKLSLEQEQLSDQWKAQVTQMSNDVIPTLIKVVAGMNDLGLKVQAARDLGYNYYAMSAEQTRQVNALADAEKNYGAALDESDRHKSDSINIGVQQSETAKQQIHDGAELVKSIIDAQSEMDRYNTTQQDLLAKKSQIIDEYNQGKLSLDKENTALQDVNASLDKNASDHEQWAKKVIFSMLQAQVAAKVALDPSAAGSLNDFLITAGEKMGFFDSTTADAMKNVNDSLDTLDTGNADKALQTIMDDVNFLQNNGQIDLNVNVTQTGASLNNVVAPPNATGANNGCFVAGTMVLTESGASPIETLQIGDVVMSYDVENKVFVRAEIIMVFVHPENEYHGHLKINGILEITDEHPVYVNGKWERADQLKPGDILTSINGEIAVETIENINAPQSVYNIETGDASHNYFANGILVHNKATGGDFIVPPGYAGDSYPVSLTSGEHVIINPVGRGGENSGMTIQLYNSQIVLPSTMTEEDITKAISYVSA